MRARAAAARKINLARSLRSDPIVKGDLAWIYEEGVVCQMCGQFLEIAGTHFSRKHGIPKSDNRVTRLRTFGLPMGSRLASAEQRDFHRKASDELQTWRFLPGGDRPHGARMTKEDYRLPRSKAQKATADRLAHLSTINAENIAVL